MPLREEDLLKLCEILINEEGFAIGNKTSKTRAIFAIGGAFIGGLFGGSLGSTIGGAAGSVLGLGVSIVRRKWKSAARQVIKHDMSAKEKRKLAKSTARVIKHELSAKEKRKLAKSVHKVVRNLKPSDMSALSTVLTRNEALRKSILGTIEKTLTKDMGYSLTKKI